MLTPEPRTTDRHDRPTDQRPRRVRIAVATVALFALVAGFVLPARPDDGAPAEDSLSLSMVELLGTETGTSVMTLD